MDDRQRSTLLAERTQVEAVILRLSHELAAHGDVLMQLGQALKTQPEGIMFTNAPRTLNSERAEFYNPNTFGYDWMLVRDMQHLVLKIQNYRQALLHLPINSQLIAVDG